MSALLLKDFYVLWKQLKAFLVLILVFSAIPGGYNIVFAVAYAAMLPYTCMAYDERSKWDQLADMMPYSTRQLVLSRYVLGWIAAAAACGFSLVLQAIFSAFLGSSVFPASLLVSFFACLSIMAITLPLIFRFGVERGRLLMFFLIFLVCGASGVLGAVTEDLSGAFPSAVWLIVPATLVLTAVSIPLSVRCYARRSW